MNIHTTRRNVLKGGGALIVTFTIASPVADAFAQGAAKPGIAKVLDPKEVDAYLAIDNKGIVTIFSGKVDLGTGISTALPQMVAEELDIPMNRVKFISGDTMLTPDQGKTWGSVTIQIGGIQLRQAAATARSALLDEAAKRLKADKADLVVTDGAISVKGQGRKVTYAEIIGGKNFSLKLDEKAPQKKPADYKIVGKPVKRVDIPDKVTGRFTYAHDFKLPNMLHARVVRPPAMGATLESVDEGSVKNIPGFVQLVRQGNFLAVVARNEWASIKAARQLKASWSKWEGLPDQTKLWEHVRSTKVAMDQETSKAGDAAAELNKEGVKKVTATYDFAINTHGSMGPSCAVADFRNGKLTMWTPSQAPHDLRKDVAVMLGMSADDVRCIYLEGSGCYGRNGHEDASADAALIAKTIGKPVRVQWSRADEHGWDPKGPPTLIDLRGAIDAAGNVTAWESEFFIPQQTAGRFHVPLVAATLSGMQAQKDVAPGNVFQNSAIPYKFANVRTLCRRLETTPFTPSWIRTPGRMQNTYANECFMDELAAAASADPIAFRKKYLDPKDVRGIECIDRAAKLAKWEARPSPKKDVSGNILKGRGFSYVKYELVRTYVASIADIEVDRSTGVIKVTKFYVAHDCGQIINPDGLKNQLDGNVLQTVSRTLKEEIKFSRSAVTTLDWASYPILTFPEMPEIVYDIIDRPNERPWGAGEPAAAIVPSTISNAFFDATGVRLRSVPYTPDKVKAALAATRA